MTGPSKGGLSPPTAVTALLGALLLLLALAAPGAAQDPLSEAEARFQEALTEYDASRARVQRTFSVAEQAREPLDSGRPQGAAAPEQAYARYYTLSMELMSAEGEAQRAAERLRQAGRALVAVLEAEEARLLDRLDTETNPLARARLQEEWAWVRRRTIQVDQLVGAGLEAELTLRSVPELGIDPRDGFTELQNKASFMEEEAAHHQAMIADLDRRIDETERRIQQVRVQADQIADIGRFDSDLIPGGRLGPRGGVGGARDDGTAGAGAADAALAELSLPEQLTLFQGLRARAIENLEFALAQAELFRATAEGRSPR